MRGIGSVVACAVLTCTALVGLVTPSTAGAGVSSDSTLEPSATGQLDLLLTQLRDRFGVTGIAALVDVPGRGTYVGTAGSADFAGDVPLTPDAHFRIGSNTKPFTATVALQLVGEGLLSLEEPISTYASGWAPVVLPFQGNVRVEDLLHHTSGIADFNTNPTYQAEINDPNHVFAPVDLVGYAAELPVGGPGCPEDTSGANDENVQPPAPFCYSNTNFVLLGLIVEQITHRPIDVEIRDRIIDPLGLVDTSFPATSTAMPSPGTEGSVSEVDLSTGRVERGPLGPTTLPLVNPSALGAAGAMISTLADLGRWLPMLTDGALVPAPIQRLRLDDVVPTVDEFEALTGFAGATTAPSYGPLDYGLGIMKLGPYFGHDGLINGWESVAVRDPTTGVSVVMLWNTTVYVTSSEEPTPSNPGIVADALLNVLGILAAPVPVPAAPTFTG
jgi:D-alanyl-D-alanine carboxypeptidase